MHHSGNKISSGKKARCATQMRVFLHLVQIFQVHQVSVLGRSALKHKKSLPKSYQKEDVLARPHPHMEGPHVNLPFIAFCSHALCK